MSRNTSNNTKEKMNSNRMKQNEEINEVNKKWELISLLLSWYSSYVATRMCNIGVT